MGSWGIESPSYEKMIHVVVFLAFLGLEHMFAQAEPRQRSPAAYGLEASQSNACMPAETTCGYMHFKLMSCC